MRFAPLPSYQVVRFAPLPETGTGTVSAKRGGLETVPVPVSSQKTEALLASRGLIVDDHHPLLFGCVPEGQWITRSVTAARWFGGQRFVHHRRVSQCGHPAIGADKDALGEGVGRIAAVVGGGNDRRRAALRIPKSTIPTRSLGPRADLKSFQQKTVRNLLGSTPPSHGRAEENPDSFYNSAAGT